MRATLLALALAACTPTPPPPPEAPQTPPPVQNLLVGTRWDSATGGLNAPSIEFQQNRAGGDTSCNRWFSTVANDGPALRFGGINTTRRACAPEIMEIEREFVADLTATERAQIEGDTLILYDISGAELARFTRHR